MGAMSFVNVCACIHCGIVTTRTSAKMLRNFAFAIAGLLPGCSWIYRPVLYAFGFKVNKVKCRVPSVRQSLTFTGLVCGEPFDTVPRLRSSGLVRRAPGQDCSAL